MICEHCEQFFIPKDKKRDHRFCSRNCSNVRWVKVTAAMLRPFAEMGTRLKVIAHKLGIAYASVRRALSRYGLYEIWQQNRFKKCASPTVGHTSAIIASAMVTTPLSESAALTAGGTSCGT